MRRTCIWCNGLFEAESDRSDNDPGVCTICYYNYSELKKALMFRHSKDFYDSLHNIMDRRGYWKEVK